MHVRIWDVGLVGTGGRRTRRLGSDWLDGSVLTRASCSACVQVLSGRSRARHRFTYWSLRRDQPRSGRCSGTGAGVCETSRLASRGHAGLRQSLVVVSLQQRQRGLQPLALACARLSLRARFGSTPLPLVDRHARSRSAIILSVSTGTPLEPLEKRLGSGHRAPCAYCSSFRRATAAPVLCTRMRLPVHADASWDTAALGAVEPSTTLRGVRPPSASHAFALSESAPHLTPHFAASWGAAWTSEFASRHAGPVDR